MRWKRSNEGPGSRRRENGRLAGLWPASRAVLRWLLFVGTLSALMGAAHGAQAKVFASQKQALAEAFPDATRIDRKTFVLRREQSARIGEILRARADAKVVVIHVAYKGEQILGFAEIAVHKVRTQPEAMLLVLSPDGRIRSVRIIAFHEPLDYLPTDSWYAQFIGKKKGDGLLLDRDIHGVVGATLSAQAAADGVRRFLAYFEVLLLPAYGPVKAP